VFFLIFVKIKTRFMQHIELDIERIRPFVQDEILKDLQKEIHYHHQILLSRTGKGNDFLGWIDLPQNIDEELIARIESDAADLRSRSEVVVVIGIGGSYLGAKAVIDALKPAFTPAGSCDLVYAGHQLSASYLNSLLKHLSDKSFSIVVISKSGTTTEPAIAFRVLKRLLEERYGKADAASRIIAITDKARGALKKMADQEQYRTYEIPDDVGGRFSVLTPVGLLPVAIAGFSIRELINGAKAMQEMCLSSAVYEENPAALYAAARNALYRMGKPLEVMVNYEPALMYISEWWKQLYGESEGKENRGIFPASVSFTTDLHSMGQYLQDGLRVIFETVLSVRHSSEKLLVPNDPDDPDGLNFLAGKDLHYVNQMAETGTMLAHQDGGIPIIRLVLPEINPFYIGELLYFFEFGCGLSAYLLEVNPFDQPGVEAYKKNMFALLAKPGFEADTLALQKRLGLK
jgi:glucose-6-phosphate isomerase